MHLTRFRPRGYEGFQLLFADFRIALVLGLPRPELDARPASHHVRWREKSDFRFKPLGVLRPRSRTNTDSGFFTTAKRGNNLCQIRRAPVHLRAESRGNHWGELMPPNIGWPDIALRLALTLVAGILIGLNRGEHGSPAGLRTILLVCFAASVAMIQANLLLATSGRTSDSFIMMDLMRLPLGILSGMGFIGAAAIIHRSNFVMGVTTAATLWFVTVMGLCLGGGQLALGVVTLGLGIFVLSGLKWFEKKWSQERHASLILVAGSGGPTDEEVTAILRESGFNITSFAVTLTDGLKCRELNCDVRWRGYITDVSPPAFLTKLAQHAGVQKLSWKP